MASAELSAEARFKALWDIGEAESGGLVESVVVESTPVGSLRPERRRVRAAGVAGEVLFVGNIEVVFGDQDSGLRERLRLLEALAALHPATV